MKNLKVLADLVAELANVGEDIVVHKSWTSIGMLMDEAMALTSVEWSALKDEALNADADELAAHIKDKLDFDDDTLEARVEKITHVVLKLSEMGLDLYEVFKPVKA